MECRDWLKTLWPASFKGVPFYFESDEEEGGRGLVIHEFPNRDDPFVEDLGEAPRYYSGTAYVHGDDADTQAVRLAETFAGRGAGTLTVPIAGPVQVHCQTFKRRHERDRLGYVAFEIKFVRDGAAFGLVSIGSLLNSAFGAVDRLAGALASVWPSGLAISGQADHVVNAAVDSTAHAISALDVARTSNATDPAASAKLRDRIDRLIDVLPGGLATPVTHAGDDLPDRASDLIVSDQVDAAVIAAEVTAIARDLSNALPAATAMRVFDDMMQAFAQAVPMVILSPSAARVAQNIEAASRLARLASLQAYTLAALQRQFTSRPEGVTARGDLAERYERELFALSADDAQDLYVAIENARGAAIEYLSRRINDLAPVITVRTNRALPSLFLAWRLYADPLRSSELVERNRVRHPSFMPEEISALSR